MKSFITGSRAYGQVTESSDIDLVIRCNHEVKNKLLELSDSRDEDECIRFGILNVIACTDDVEFSVWLTGTTALKRDSRKKSGAICKSEAKKKLDKLREIAGIRDNGGSGGPEGAGT